MKIWRIAAETRDYRAEDISGAGAAKSPGRWNKHDEPVLYCAETRALAVLETTAHVNHPGLPLNRFLVEIDVADRVWEARERLATLPPAWEAIPAGRASIELGSDWLASGRSAILVVPSVIVPEEHVVLVNPRHADIARITAQTIRRFEYARLLR